MLEEQKFFVVPQHEYPRCFPLHGGLKRVRHSTRRTCFLLRLPLGILLSGRPNHTNCPQKRGMETLLSVLSGVIRPSIRRNPPLAMLLCDCKSLDMAPVMSRAVLVSSHVMTTLYIVLIMNV